MKNYIPNNLRKFASRYAANINGWKTDRKIIVIESDDWGSIRMPSKEVYRKCLKAGYPVDENSYESFDSLASEDDLELLFEVIASYKDCNGKNPVFTANVLVANPDFKKIRDSGFRQYHYESIINTFNKYPKHSGCLSLWNSGKKAGIFYPQSHGREHLNVSLFMNALRMRNKDVHFGFKNEMPGSLYKGNAKYGNKFIEALSFQNHKDKQEKLSIIKEGLLLFEKLFGYKSESFIPPNYTWSPDFDRDISDMGVRYYQGIRKMKEPLIDGSVRMRKHSTGDINTFNQIFLIRNSFFEPSLSQEHYDSVNQCLLDIDRAFRMKKPAIICSHRLNYVGFINERNRDKNLTSLNNLFKEILKKWPDVEFCSSTELGIEIKSTINN